MSVEEINKRYLKNTLMEQLGIVITGFEGEVITAKMPVDKRTHQPVGLLHGGASVALAESIGSMASFLMLLDNPEAHVVGLEINANHIRAVKSGFVYATGNLLHKGKSTHIWDIKIRDESEKLVCVCRLTNAVIYKK